MKKVYKYGIWVVIIAFTLYNSVYFRKLSEMKAPAKTFNAASYAQDMLNNKLPAVTEKAITIDELFTQIKSQPNEAFSAYGHALTIGSIRFFMVKGAGEVDAIDESDVKLVTTGHNNVYIATEFVFGNAIRDASGLINLNDFSNTVDLSNISSEVNKIIRAKVIPPFKAVVKKGSKVEFTGAIELNQARLNVEDPEVIPVTLKVLP
ncbi:hypothetical protein BEL04_09095 [Mucilaginibacter sp. PPCGB 2223]|uniref:DUF2291 domain-containing protein n=1 Tax=Mucilaginibacter sp. PPCGB 2223 TaxID=1886027 RepID=UPI000824E354|nr:DUF2291 domain-containing protein [Mucilaginibacter sp. PPCGB 2223]OCX54396.1 hypothetical protein BEL04_09095 [Mucilaginibacter sp. PPCGB 2223]